MSKTKPEIKLEENKFGYDTLVREEINYIIVIAIITTLMEENDVVNHCIAFNIFVLNNNNNNKDNEGSI